MRKFSSLINTAPNSSKIVMHRTLRHAPTLRELHTRAAPDLAQRRVNWNLPVWLGAEALETPSSGT
jgi:hypothetical protein